MTKAYKRDIASLDGRILNVVATDIGDAQTRYTYFDLARAGYNCFTLQHIITATTLTIEVCNGDMKPGETISAVASGTDGTGATIVCVALNTTHGFATDDALTGIQVRILADQTTPANVGLTRTVVDYAQATGILTLSSALGATTAGVTQFILEDNPNAWNRMMSDPTSTQWVDVTNALTGAASATTTGVWIIDTPLAFERVRIKRLTTNATNALTLRLTRGVA